MAQKQRTLADNAASQPDKQDQFAQEVSRQAKLLEVKAKARQKPAQERARAHEQAKRQAQKAKVKAAMTFHTPARISAKDYGQMTPQQRIRYDLQYAGSEYFNAVAAADTLGDDRLSSAHRRAQSLDGMHRVAVKRMAIAVLEPLSHDVSSESVIQSAGMAVSMWLLSPDFRDQVDSALSGGREGYRNAVVNKVEQRKAADPDSPVPARWERRLERIENARRGGRPAFTGATAGLTEVALTEQAARLMHEGSGPELVQQNLRAMVRTLYGMAGQDGVAAEEIARNARQVVAKHLSSDPDFAVVYDELAYGEFLPSPAVERMDPETGEVRRFSPGTFTHLDGSVAATGSFSPRPRFEAPEHNERIAQVMAMDLMTAPNNAAAMNEMLVGYYMATDMRAEDLPDGMEERISDRIQRGNRMIGAMVFDGVGAEDVELTYRDALDRAVSVLGQTRPKLAKQWAERYGARWQETAEHEGARTDDPQATIELLCRTSQHERGEDEAEAGRRGTHATSDHDTSDHEARREHGHANSVDGKMAQRNEEEAEDTVRKVRRAKQTEAANEGRDVSVAATEAPGDAPIDPDIVSGTVPPPGVGPHFDNEGMQL